MARPTCQIDKQKFWDNYRQGLPDQMIAEALGVSRTTVIRLRKSYGLAANRTRGERGPETVRENKPYYLEARRLLKHVAKYVYAAAREYRISVNNTDDYTSWCATIIEPGPIPQPRLFPYVSAVEKTTISAAKFAANVEEKADRAGIAGVPGPAIFKLARVFKTADKKTIEELAMQAVKGAGYVGVDESVEQVLARGTIMVTYYQAIWKERMETAVAWAPVKTVKKRTAAYCPGHERYGGGTGKRSRTGNGCIQDVDRQIAFLGASGY